MHQGRKRGDVSPGRNGPRRWGGCRAGAVPMRAQIRAQNLHSGKKWQMGRLTLSYPGLSCGTSFDIYPMEFDADQLLGPPYHRAPGTLIGDQKYKLRRDRADYLKRRSSLGLVTNETGDCAPAELDASGLHEATPVQ